MALLLPYKSMLLAVLRLLKRKLVQELSDATGLTVKQIGGIERGAVKNPPSSDLALLSEAMLCSHAEVIIVSACLEGLDGLDTLTGAAEAAAQEQLVAAAARRLRRRLRVPGAPETSEYPASYEVEPDRAEARSAWERLRGLKTLQEMAVVVRVAREFQCWALVELLCDQSARAAAKDAGRARDLAVVAVRIACRLDVREGWRRRLLGFAAAHLANALRVIGRLEAADRTLAAAKRLWAAGEDPDFLLDPGRLLDLEASLRRGQRRFEESLGLLEQADVVTRRPEHVSLKKAATLAVMGEYHRAIAILTEAAPRVEVHPEARLRTIHLFNLAVSLSHVGHHRQAARLLPDLRSLTEGDEIDRIRTRWLEGRLAAGLGQTEAALKVLAESRAAFAERNMHYDVALSLLESAALHLERGELAEVRQLTGELAPIFEKNGVHEEALNALRLFEEAVTRQAATAELARCLLDWLFRAQYDQGLVFRLPQ